MSCPGIPSNQPPGDPFPINTNDPSRRRLHRAWPADASSSAFSRRVELVAGERYWMQLECQMSGVSHDPPSAPPPVQPPPLPTSPPAPPPPLVTARLLGGLYANCGGTYQRGQETTKDWYTPFYKPVWHQIACENGNPCSGRVLYWGWDSKWICSYAIDGAGYAGGGKGADEWCEGDWGSATAECPNSTDWKLAPPPPPAPPSPPPPPPTLAFSGKPGSSTVYQPSCAVGARCAGGRASARST